MFLSPLKTVSLLLTFDPLGPLDPGSPVFPCLKEDRRKMVEKWECREKEISNQLLQFGTAEIPYIYITKIMNF